MRTLKDILKENKKEDEHKPVFKETDPQAPFPNDTIKALEREINKGAKDLETEWDSAIELVDNSFKVLKVPKPTLLQKERWEQYRKLIGEAVKQLFDARGLEGNWKKFNK
jgi:hypothetical protein